MKKPYFVFIFCIFTSLITYHVLQSQPSKYEGKIVKKILFQGVENLSNEDLHALMITTVGYPLKADEIQKDIKAIFNEGRFLSVTVEVDNYEDGVQLRFICKERPIIRDIVFKGNSDIQDTELTNMTFFKINDVYQKDKIEKSIIAIKQHYNEKGLFNAVVRYKIEKKDNNENRIKVIIIIDEGEEVRIQKVSILGAEKVYDKLLKEIMATTEQGFIASGLFEQAKYEMDKTNIIAYYKELGYLDARIISDQVDYEWIDPIKKEQRGIYITLKLYEGEKYYFDKYTVKIQNSEKKTVYTQNDFFPFFQLKKHGQIFNNTSFLMDRQMINFKYASKGYIFTRVVPNRTVTEKKVTINGKTEVRKYVRIDYEITEGSQAYIDTIIVKGNYKTKDRVIRRECLLKEGELFDARKLQLTREKIYNLGYFKQVNIDVRSGSRQGFMNLIIDVEEQATGTVSLGGGYGTSSGFSIFGNVGEKNLNGTGQKVNVKIEYGPERSSITLEFTEPWFMDKPVSLSSSIFYIIDKVASESIFPDQSATAFYHKRSLGYSIGLGYRPWIYYSVGSVWRHAFSDIYRPSNNASLAVFDAAAEGIQEKRTVRFYINRNSKNNYLNPTKGMQAGLRVSFTGGYIGGDDHHIKYEPEFYWYFSPFSLPYLQDYPCVFEFRANGTFYGQPLGAVRQNPYENPWLEPEDRLTLGGAETIRGWDAYDYDLPDSWRTVGVFHRILFGLEFRVPIHKEMLWMAFFFDAGSLWSDKGWLNQMESGSNTDTARDTIEEDIRNGELYNLDRIDDIDLMSYFIYSYGLGFRIQIPSLPLRFWFGKKMIYENDEFVTLGGFNFQFQIGDFRF